MLDFSSQRCLLSLDRCLLGHCRELLTHWYAQQANNDLNASHGIEDPCSATSNKPIVRFECQSERKDILEDEKTRERLNCDSAYSERQQGREVVQRERLTISINDVQSTGDSSQHHAHHFESKEEVWPEPAILFNICS